MEDLSKRVPMMNKWILENVDNKTLVNFKEASREIHQVFNNDRFYWIRMLNKHRKSFEEFQESWKIILLKTPTFDVKELALAVNRFFKANPKRHVKQWHPLFIGRSNF